MATEAAARRRPLAVVTVLTVVAALGACQLPGGTAAGAGEGAGRVTVSGGTPAAPAGLPGFFDNQAFSVAPAAPGRATLLLSRTDCNGLAAALGATGWTVMADAAGMSLAGRVLLLARGGDRLVVSLHGTDGCIGSVAAATPSTVAATGPVTASGSGTAYPLLCTGGASALTAVLLLVGPGDLRALVAMSLEKLHTGDSALTEGNLSQVALGNAPSTPSQVLAGLAGLGAEPPESMPGVGPVLRTDDAKGSLNLTSLTPVQGTLRLTNLAGPAGPGQSLTAGFTCPSTG